MLTRRGFLGILGGLAAVELVKPVSYFFAPKSGWIEGERGIATPAKYLSIDEVLAMQQELIRPNLEDMYFKSKMLGMTYWQTGSNSGTYLGIARSRRPIRIPIGNHSS